MAGNPAEAPLPERPPERGTRRPREPCHQRLRNLWSACPLRRQQCIGSSAPEPQKAARQAEAESQVDDDAPEERICRYCFDGEEVSELISPCRCIGGQKYVHLSCHRMWQRAVLMAQPTHPDTYGRDSRQSICNVCKSEFTCPPPTRTELMASITGPEIAALIDDGCLIGSAEAFSNDLDQQMQGFPESVRERVVCRNWIRGIFLIVKVVHDRHQEIVTLKLGSGEEVGMLMEQLSEDAQTIKLRGRKFTIVLRGPLRHLQANSSAEERRETMRALQAPVSLRLRPEATTDCGEDGVIAVNLTRTLDLVKVRSPLKAHWNQVLADAAQHVLGSDDAEMPFKVSHFLGGPCDDETVAACLILTEGRCSLIQDKDCLRHALATANTVAMRGWQALADEGLATDRAPWFRELPQLERSDDDADNAEERSADQADEPASKRQKHESGTASGSGDSGVPSEPFTADEAAVAAAAGPTPKLQVRLLVMWGYAGWSRCQLMGEIARGSWGLCRAMPEDVLQRGPSDLWKDVYPRLMFAPTNSMSESYGGQVPEEEERRRQLRHMAIFHEILHGRLGYNRPPTPEPDAAGPAGDGRGASPDVDLDNLDDEAIERARAEVDGLDDSLTDSEEDFQVTDDDEENDDDEDSEVESFSSQGDAPLREEI